MTVPSGAVVGGAQDEVGDQRGPARLVAGADAPAGVTVEVLVEGQQVVPVPVGLEEAGVAEDRAAAILVVEEDRNQTAGKVCSSDRRRCAESTSQKLAKLVEHARQSFAWGRVNAWFRHGRPVNA